MTWTTAKIFATVETFAQNVRHARRSMRRDPAFTFTALATLALGIGLNTAIVSVAYGVLCWQFSRSRPGGVPPNPFPECLQTPDQKRSMNPGWTWG